MLTLDQKMFDLSLLEEMDDKEFVIQIVKLYLTETPKELAEMSRACRIMEADTIAEKAHKLKSSTGMLQANQLFTVLEETETMAKSGKITLLLKEKIEQVNDQFQWLKAALQLQLQTLQMEAV